MISRFTNTDMAIPTGIDGALGEIDDLHSVVLVRLRVWHHGGPDRDPRRITEALRSYVDAVTDFVNGDAK
jgi:hypothetical protein